MIKLYSVRSVCATYVANWEWNRVQKVILQGPKLRFIIILVGIMRMVMPAIALVEEYLCTA
jgi:hypothetical protein